MVDLNTLTPIASGWTLSKASGINDAGQITGSGTINGFGHAFLYGGGSITDLGTLPGGTYSEGVAINALGQVTGTASSSLAPQRPFLYSAGGMTDLGSLGGSYSAGLGINNSGQVTGYSYNSDNSAQRAFLYTPGSGMVDLNTLIPIASGWTLVAAYGINDAGQITGYGLRNGETHAFFLSPAIVPFSAFAAHLEIGGTPPTIFEITGTFSLGAGSNGIDPVNEEVTLKLGTYSATIPKNSFIRTSKGIFTYEGSVGGAALEFRIAPVATGYTFTAEGSRVTGLPASHSLSVTLTIGDDSGTQP